MIALMYLWASQFVQEKQKAKVKEKLDKCVKDKLLDFCDILDVPVSRATMKKVVLSYLDPFYMVW